MTITLKNAVIQYHLSEHLKLEIMTLAHQLITIPSLKKDEKLGAKLTAISILESILTEAKSAAAITDSKDLLESCSIIDETIKLAESNQFGLASEKAGEAITQITTAAAESFAVLSENGLI
ncbi:MAG TPA: hypothetical protein O0W90_03185 [Methanocorpusculum sp.]|nr:hypothetical protein [Methanocorpusculum sp.]